ncbi:MAG: ATP-binding protein [Oligoflexales bacterium]
MSLTIPLKISHAAICALLGFLFLAGAELGNALSAPGTPFTTFWPPAGILFYFLVANPKKRWPTLLLSAGAANLVFDIVLHSRPLPFALGFTLLNLSSAVIGCLILGNAWRDVSNRRDWRIVLAAVMTPLVSATLAAILLDLLNHPLGDWVWWPFWFASDGTGLFVVAPLLKVIHERLLDRDFLGYRRLETLLYFTLLAAVSVFVFSATVPGLGKGLQFAFLVFPLLVWAATRLSELTVMVSVFLVTVVAIWGASQGHGFFMRAELPVFYVPLSVEAYAMTLMITSWSLVRSVKTKAQLNERLAVKADRLSKLNSELTEARAKAEAASSTKSWFVATISHEMRTPLSSVIGFADLLTEEDVPEATRQEYVESIAKAAHHLGDIISDVLDLGKVEAGRLEIEKVKFSPQQLFDDVKSILKPMAESKGLTLTFRTRGIPARIVTDPTRLRQVLFNAVGNAIKFTQSGGVTVEAWTDNEDGEVYLFIQITDTGIGMNPEEQRRLFKPYAQAASATSRHFGGTGLGLVLCRHLAQAMGGDYRLIRSIPGSGSIFALKIAAGPKFLDEEVPERKLPAMGTNALKGWRILVADDAPELRQLLRISLERAGAAVTCAADGLEAITATEDNRFDVVLMDVHMPRMNGRQAAHVLKKRGLAAPIIALTAGTSSVEVSDNSGDFEGTLGKPVNRDTLVAKILDVARGRAAS